jgi:hypothetical protein
MPPLHSNKSATGRPPMLRAKSVWSPINRKTDGLRILATRIRGHGLPASRTTSGWPIWVRASGCCGPSRTARPSGRF